MSARVGAWLLMSVLVTSSVSAQNGGPGGNQGNGPGFPGGIQIDADGVVRQRQYQSIDTPEIRRLFQDARRRSEQRTGRNGLRCVSLRQLEQRCAALIEEGQLIPDDVRGVAGLTRIDYLCFVDPPGGQQNAEDQSDVWIAGPAEPTMRLPHGPLVGIESGRPVLHLDDLLIALRSGNMGSAVGCSFDPDPQRLLQSQQFLRANQQQQSAQAGLRMFEQMASILGHWNVSIFGVPRDSRMALALVEADYALKRLTLGLDQPPVRGFRSQLAVMKPGEDLMRRWWFVPRYDTLKSDEQQKCFHLSGPRIQLRGQEEIMDASGQRIPVSMNQKSTAEYAVKFSQQIDDLALHIHAFAELQNIVDVLTTAALIREGRRNGTCSWTPTLFSDDDRMPAERFSTPVEVPSMANARMAGRSFLVGLVSGGVTIDPRQILEQKQPTTQLMPLSGADRPAADSLVVGHSAARDR